MAQKERVAKRNETIEAAQVVLGWATRQCHPRESGT